jgi:hypothetical protein
VEDIMGEQTTVKLWTAAGKTLEELIAAGHRFDVLHEEALDDPRPLVRQLRFPNLMQALEFAKLFDPGAHADVWLVTTRGLELFDSPVSLAVVFRLEERPAIVHGEDDMRDVAREIRRSRADALAADPRVHGAPTSGQLDAYHALRAGQRRH